MAIVVTRCGKQPDFKFRCSKSWDELEERDGDGNVRFCLDCQKPVYFVESENAFTRAARLGRCVAIEVDDGSREQIFMVGIPAGY